MNQFSFQLGIHGHRSKTDVTDIAVVRAHSI
jgi:hypothetical protein